jgi:cupin 2 domain-containing protein
MNAMNPDNVFAELPEHDGGEHFTELLTRPGIRIERIVSSGQASAPGFWYDQPHAEWVLLLRGKATLRFEDQPDLIVLEPGSYIDIAAHRRHRVEWTDPEQTTIWLAIHYQDDIVEVEGTFYAPVKR